MMSTEMIDKLFLELSLVTNATTVKELALLEQNAKLMSTIDEMESDHRRTSDECDRLRSKTFARFNEDECWIFQGKPGDDRLESLAAPVVIKPSELLHIIKRAENAERQLKEFDNLTDELTKGIGAASCINPLTDMKNAIAKVRGFFFKPFERDSTLNMLYEAWRRLPASELMGVIGAAIQDLQFHQEEIVRMRERHALETAQLRNQIDQLMKTVVEGLSLNPAPIEIRMDQQDVRVSLPGRS